MNGRGQMRALAGELRHQAQAAAQHCGRMAGRMQDAGNAAGRFCKDQLARIPKPVRRSASLRPVVLPSLDIVAICAGCLVFIFLFVDAPVLRWARGIGMEIKAPFYAFMRFGNADWILAVTLMTGLGALALQHFLALRQRVRVGLRAFADAAIFVFVTVAASGLTVVVFKRIIGRARPRLFDEVGALQFEPLSFASGMEALPSGHTVTAFALAIALGFLVPRLLVLLVVLAVWMGIARVALGSHYVSDVTIGVLFGIWAAHFSRLWFARRRLVFDIRADGEVRRRGGRAMAAAAAWVCDKISSLTKAAISGGMPSNETRT